MPRVRALIEKYIHLIEVIVDSVHRLAYTPRITKHKYKHFVVLVYLSVLSHVFVCIY